MIKDKSWVIDFDDDIWVLWSLFNEDHSESCHISLPVVFSFGAVFGVHALDCCLSWLLDLLDHNTNPADLTLPHDKLDSALFLKHIG